MSKVTCPYCNKEFEVDTEIFEHDVEVYDVMEQQECPECGKFVNITRSVRVSYEAEECPCQTENHDWEMSETYPPYLTYFRCIHCGTERKPTEEERREYNIPTKEEYFKQLDNLSYK